VASGQWRVAKIKVYGQPRAHNHNIRHKCPSLFFFAFVCNKRDRDGSTQAVTEHVPF
jgi:hypothetical protein